MIFEYLEKTIGENKTERCVFLLLLVTTITFHASFLNWLHDQFPRIRFTQRFSIDTAFIEKKYVYMALSGCFIWADTVWAIRTGKFEGPITIYNDFSLGLNFIHDSSLSWDGFVTMLSFFSIYAIWKREDVMKGIDKFNRSYQRLNLDIHAWEDVAMYQLSTYWTANAMALPSSLGMLTFLLIILGGAAFSLYTGQGFLRSVFLTWTFIVDPSSHANLPDNRSTAMGLFMTLIGLVIFGFLISIITDIVSSTLNDFKNGKFRVIEKDHFIILGWSGKALSVIRQLAIYQLDKQGGVVVVLADSPKAIISDDIIQQFGGFQVLSTSVIVHSGCPNSEFELQNISIETAKSVIILADDSKSSYHSDATAIRTAIALLKIKVLSGHMVIELNKNSSVDCIDHVAMHLTETILTDEVIGRLMVQCARQRNLAMVFDSLLGFEGDEIYFADAHNHVGSTFGETSRNVGNITLIGVKSPNETLINPKSDTVISAGDKLVLLAKDEEAVSASSLTPIFSLKPSNDLHAVIRSSKLTLPPGVEKDTQHNPEKILILGWQIDIPNMINFIDDCVAPNSKLTIMSEVPIDERKQRIIEFGSVLHYNHITLQHVLGNPMNRQDLQKLPIVEFTSILVLADCEASNSKLADSCTIASLLLIQDINRRELHLQAAGHKGKANAKKKKRAVWLRSAQEKKSTRPTIIIDDNAGIECEEQSRFKHQNILCEVVETSNHPRSQESSHLRSLANYVASNKLLARIMAMVGVQPELNSIISGFLSANGNRIMTQPSTLYAVEGEKLNWYELSARAMERGECAIGYIDRDVLYMNPTDKTVSLELGTTEMEVVVIMDKKLDSSVKSKNFSPETTSDPSGYGLMFFS